MDSNDLEEGDEVISVATVVNGVRPSDIPSILEQLRKLRSAIKSQAFEALRWGVAARDRDLRATRALDESLHGLRQVRAKVEGVYLRLARETASSLTWEESVFLENVRRSVPDILAFTERQFRAIVKLM